METVLGITATYNIPAEQEILGAVFINNDHMCDISLKAEDFYFPKHQLLFRIMQKLYSEDKVIDITTIAEELKNDLQGIGGFSYLTEIINSAATLDKSKIDIVREKANIRRLYNLLGKSLEDIKSNKRNFNEFYNELQNGIFTVSEDKDELLTDNELMRETIELIDKNMSLGGKILGYESGLTELDKAVNGFQKGKLYVIAGRPSMGKSALALNISHGISKTRYVSYYSLEMGREELGLRRLSMSSLVDGAKIERGNLTDEEWKKIMNSANLVSNQKMVTNDSAGIHINDIYRQSKKLKIKKRLDMIVIDHIGIMDKTGLGDTIREQTTNICIKLKNMAKEFDIPVILLSQLSRAPEERADKRPLLKDLKESSGIEENADIVMLIYRDEYYNPDTGDKGIIEVNVAKQRGGRTGVIKLGWLPQFQKVASVFK